MSMYLMPEEVNYKVRSSSKVKNKPQMFPKAVKSHKVL